MFFHFQLGLAAYDSNYPNDKAYANATISVNRNPNAPGFTTSAYSITVNESFPLAVSLLQIAGQDDDQVSPPLSLFLSLSLSLSLSFLSGTSVIVIFTQFNLFSLKSISA